MSDSGDQSLSNSTEVVSEPISTEVSMAIELGFVDAKEEFLASSTDPAQVGSTADHQANDKDSPRSSVKNL